MHNKYLLNQQMNKFMNKNGKYKLRNSVCLRWEQGTEQNTWMQVSSVADQNTWCSYHITFIDSVK
jgi:hypothetical protein